MKREKIILIADILGFSSIVQNFSDIELDLKIDNWIKLIEDLTNKYNFTDFQLLSDTLFLITDTNEDQFVNLINFSKELLQEGLKINIPIKGGICSGEVIWSKLIYGKAVIQAHKIESNQNWIGITCISELGFENKYFDFGKLITYPTPYKKGPFILHSVIDWKIPSINETLKSTFFGPKGTVVDSKILDYLDNTFLFNNYKIWLFEKGLTPDKYYGLTRTHFLENSNINN